MSKYLPSLLASSLLLTLPLAASLENESVSSLGSLSASSQGASSKESSSEFFIPFTGRITGSKVRMRSQPNLEGHVVKEMSNGELFAVVGLENDFYAVEPSKGTKGYVFRTYILDGVVEAERVNIRLAPDTESPIVGRLSVGDKVQTTVSPLNNKWFEVDLPSTSRFYIAKEYIEKIGPYDLLVQLEAKHREGTHLLNSALLYARSEMQKPFEEIDLESIHSKFHRLTSEFADFHDIVSKANEGNSLLQETYIQKKIAFLESKADRTTAANEKALVQLNKLSELTSDLTASTCSGDSCSGSVGGKNSVLSTGLSAVASEITDKMRQWQSLEESLYHQWSVEHNGKSLDEFYQEEQDQAVQLTGIIEPYSKPVKNRPGDYLLRCEGNTPAFLYSTKINLQDLIGKEITVVGLPRPKNHFAFDAYFVVEVK